MSIPASMLESEPDYFVVPLSIGDLIQLDDHSAWVLHNKWNANTQERKLIILHDVWGCMRIDIFLADSRKQMQVTGIDLPSASKTFASKRIIKKFKLLSRFHDSI